MRQVQGYAQVRERGSDAHWLSVEYLKVFKENKLLSFAYVRTGDGTHIPDGEYEVREGLDETRRRWKKYNGEWQVKWSPRLF